MRGCSLQVSNGICALFSLQDAANLAWKVALVAAGEAAAGSQLLDTYHEERWPVGAMVIRNTGEAVAGWGCSSLQHLWAAMAAPSVYKTCVQVSLSQDCWVDTGLYPVHPIWAINSQLQPT